LKLKAFANGLLQQAELLGDGDVFIAFNDEDGDWASVSGVDLVHNGNDGTYTVYPLVDDSPSRGL
jgi:hypothetical protein